MTREERRKRTWRLLSTWLHLRTHNADNEYTGRKCVMFASFVTWGRRTHVKAQDAGWCTIDEKKTG